MGEATDARHWEASSLREKIIEHLFVGELLRHLWRIGRRDMELLRAEVDNGGYDLALGCNGRLRHVQLKASHQDGAARSVNVNIGLAGKRGACVIWIHFDPKTMALGPFHWLGSEQADGELKLGDRVARHTKADAAGHKKERPNIRQLRKSAFTKIETIDGVAKALFGL